MYRAIHHPGVAQPDTNATRQRSGMRSSLTFRSGVRPRPAFTLIEMLVVLGIIILLASLTLAFLPNINDHERATQGALTVQNALASARHQAMRDQAPRGIRLIPDATIQTAATSMQYIEQPEDFTGGSISVTITTAPTPANPYLTATLTNNAPDLYGGFGQGSPAGSNQPYWAVQPNDYLVLNGTQVYLITSATPTVAQSVITSSTTFMFAYQGTSTTGTTSLTTSVLPTSNYSIMRAPRPLAGADPIQLPDKIGIDFSTTYQGPNSGAAGMTVSRSLLTPDSHGGQQFYDILFDSTGRVLRQGVATGKIILWVRDVTDPNMGGDQVLVTVFTRSGQVAPAQVYPGPKNDFANTTAPATQQSPPYYTYSDGSTPYVFALEGQGSGL